MKSFTNHRFEFSQDEIRSVAIDRYFGGLSIDTKDGTNVTVVSNSPDKLQAAILAFVAGFKYQDGSQKHLDYLAKIIEAATTASRALSEKLEIVH